MKKVINISFSLIPIFLLSGCVENYQLATKQTSSIKKVENLKTTVLKDEKIPEIIKISKTKRQIKIPYVKESKYIKILILPFENAENDIDYGGYIETKLEPSKFIFDEKIKNKILKDSNVIGGI